MNLRDEQREQTRTRILDAVLELLETESPATISVPAVAETAGVGLRTVYRYFPTKRDLIRAAGESFGASYDDLIAERLGYHWSDPGADIGAFLAARWTEMGGDLARIRAQHQDPAGREMLATRLTDWREKSGRVIDDRVAPDLDPTERALLVDLLNALAGSSMLLELVDRQGHSPEKAAALASRAIDAVLYDARRRHDAGHADRTTKSAG